MMTTVMIYSKSSFQSLELYVPLGCVRIPIFLCSVYQNFEKYFLEKLIYKKMRKMTLLTIVEKIDCTSDVAN